MRTSTLRCLTTAIAILFVTLALAAAVHAAGAVNIDACQTLITPNTVYKLTRDISTCGECLVVAGDRITIDLQNHRLIGTCTFDAGITDNGTPYSLTVVKNGKISGFRFGIVLSGSRASVIGVEAHDNSDAGIALLGTGSLIKSSMARHNEGFGILIGERGQVQQSDASNNGGTGISIAASNCLVTMNSANNNGDVGIFTKIGHCTVSFNTANNNGGAGIVVSATHNLVTQNTAMGNNGDSDIDFRIQCPSDVTFNTSSAGFPASYQLTSSPACRTAHNE
jgi:parallel beta-helix repeat protein